MTKKIVVHSVKDESGAYRREESEVSIDSLLSEGLASIHQVMERIKFEVRDGVSISRNTVMNLKDVMTLLHALKEKEADLLEEMSDEELEKAAKK